MPSYNLTILGQEISFKTDVEEKRIKEAENLLNERFKRINSPHTRLSNEKLLILLALSLADDFLQTNQKLQEFEKRLDQLLKKIDKQS